MGVNISLGSVILGTARADTLTGGAGSDQIFGLEGSDTIDGQGGDDVLFAGAGDDVVNGRAGNDVLDGGAGLNMMSGGDGNDVLLAGPDQNLLLGGGGIDQLVGGVGADALFGGGGDDLLTGGGGLDLVAGGDGNDVLDTGAGLGAHVGGGGADTFRIGDEILNNGQADRIVAVDFKAGEDRLSIGAGALQGVTSIEDTTIDLTSALQEIRNAGFLDSGLIGRLGQLEGGETLLDEVRPILDGIRPDAQGRYTASGVSVFLPGGDRIDVIGVNRETLLGLLGGGSGTS